MCNWNSLTSDHLQHKYHTCHSLQHEYHTCHTIVRLKNRWLTDSLTSPHITYKLLHKIIDNSFTYQLILCAYFLIEKIGLTTVTWQALIMWRRAKLHFPILCIMKLNLKEKLSEVSEFRKRWLVFEQMTEWIPEPERRKLGEMKIGGFRNETCKRKKI